MLRKPLLSILFVLFSFISLAQVKEITLENIWNGDFRTERMEVLHSMKNWATVFRIKFQPLHPLYIY
jgi:hypothetical protein